jgi:segregation and condensation protein A
MYKVKLPVFEGPFDLLLYLIKKNELDIYDIPIAEITRQYLEYIQLIHLLDLEIAGEFIEMVATLMLIKSRMLLPHSSDTPEEEIADPRRQLVLQLLEYKKFKEASKSFQEFEENRLKLYPRQVESLKQNYLKLYEEENDPSVDATLFDLLTAFKKALDNMPKITVHQVKVLKVTLEEQVTFLIDKMKGKKYILFGELQPFLNEKIIVIVTFIAILDLMRVGLLSAKQVEAFSDIRLIPSKKLSLDTYLESRHQFEQEANISST